MTIVRPYATTGEHLLETSRAWTESSAYAEKTNEALLDLYRAWTDSPAHPHGLAALRKRSRLLALETELLARGLDFPEPEPNRADGRQEK